jgi:hypothetical protein
MKYHFTKLWLKLLEVYYGFLGTWLMIRILATFDVFKNLQQLLKRSIKLSESSGIPLEKSLRIVGERMKQEQDAYKEILRERVGTLKVQNEKLKAELNRLTIVGDALKQQHKNN